jgi:hypothetical protein
MTVSGAPSRRAGNLYLYRSGGHLAASIYALDQPAPIPEWQTPGDPRAKIRMADILHMSSGLRIKAPQDPDYDPSSTYPSLRSDAAI